MSVFLLQYRTYHRMDDWLSSLGPCCFFFQLWSPAIVSSEVLERCVVLVLVVGDLTVDEISFQIECSSPKIRCLCGSC